MKEYMVMAMHKFEQKEGRWGNVMLHLTGKRCASTKKEATDALRAYLKKWNGAKKYDSKGERRETFPVGGGLTGDMVHTKETDDNLRVIAWKIKVRTVTPWEEVESKTL